MNWIDPNLLPAGIDPTTIDVNDISIVNDGRTLTIVSVTDQGGGVWRYRYAEGLHAAADGSALPVQVTFVAGQVKNLAGIPRMLPHQPHTPLTTMLPKCFPPDRTAVS